MAQKRSSLGSVRNVGPNKWRMRVTVGYDAKTGKRIQREKSVDGTRRTAEDVLGKMLVEAGKAPERLSKITVASYFEDVYLPRCRERLRPDTVARYEGNVRIYIAPGIGRCEIGSLEVATVERFLKSIERPGARLSVYKTLRQGLRQARRDRIVSTVVTDAIEQPKVPKSGPRRSTRSRRRLSCRRSGARGWSPVCSSPLGASSDVRKSDRSTGATWTRSK